MARKEDRQKAIELRLQGKTYSEIKNDLGISKSTLSGWLHNLPLTENQLERVMDKIPKRIERFRNTMAKRRLAREQVAYNEARKIWLPLTKREKLLAGVFLYWGEGTKVSSSYLCISNCDPRVIKFSLDWMIHSLGIQIKDIHILLHLYSDMDINKETNYWLKILGLSLENFRRPYIKTSKLSGLTYKGFGHGTCNIYTSNKKIKDKVIQSINAISNHYAKIV